MGPEQITKLQQYAASKYGPYYAGLLTSIAELSGNDANGAGGLTQLSERQWRAALQQLQSDAASGIDLKLPQGMTIDNAGDFAKWRANPIANLHMARALMQRNEASLLRRANQQRSAAGAERAGSLLDAFNGDRSQLSFALAAAHRDGTGTPNPRASTRRGAGALIANGTFDLSALQQEYEGANDIVEYAALASDTAAEAVGDPKLQMSAPQIRATLATTQGSPGLRHIRARAAQIVPETELSDDPAVVDELLAVVPEDTVSGANGATLTDNPTLQDEEFAGRGVPQSGAFGAGQSVRNFLGATTDTLTGAFDAGREVVGDAASAVAGGIAQGARALGDAGSVMLSGANERGRGANQIVAQSAPVQRLRNFVAGLTGDEAPVQAPPTEQPRFITDGRDDQSPAAPEGEPEAPDTADFPDNPLAARTLSQAELADPTPPAAATHTASVPAVPGPAQGAQAASAPSVNLEAIRQANERQLQQQIDFENNQLADLAQQTAAIQAQQELNRLAFSLAPQLNAPNADPRQLATTSAGLSPNNVLNSLLDNQTNPGNLGVLTQGQTLDVARLAGRTPASFESGALNSILGATDPILQLRNSVADGLADQQINALGLEREEARRAAQAQADLNAASAVSAQLEQMIRDALKGTLAR